MTTQAMTRRSAKLSLNPRIRREQKLKQRKKYLTVALSVLAAIMILSGMQALFYYAHFVPRVNQANEKMLSFMEEKRTGKVQKKVQDSFNSLIASLKDEADYAGLVEDQYELLAKLFRTTPIQIADEVYEALLTLSEQFKKQGETDNKPLLKTASEELSVLAVNLKDLRDIYTVEFDGLQSELDSPPWYIWPTSRLLRTRTGYLSAVTFNRAMYLTQVGETGTARVLLTGLYAASENESMMAMIYYGLGRLQWEIFLTSSKPENYFQAAKYLRQSLQLNPDMDMAKRLFDFLMSLSQGDSSPRAGEGDPTNPSEGEAASVSEPTTLF